MDYRIRAIGRTCAATGAPLSPGESVHSVLVERHGGPMRLDFSLTGWTGPPEGAVGQWRTTVPQPDDDRPKPLDPDQLFDHFQRLLEEPNPAQQKMCYVMALLLLQKRRLTLDGSRGEGEIACLLLSGSKGEGPFEVPDQQLTGDEITSLQSELKKQLKSAA